MKPSEQRLVLILVAMLLIGAGWIVFLQMGKWKRDLERREQTTALKKVEAEELIKQKTMWTERSEWLRSKLPPYNSRSAADNALWDIVVTQSPGKFKVKLDGQQQQEPEHAGDLTSAGIMVNARGEHENVWRWVHDLQKDPASFIDIKGMKMKPDPEDTKIVILEELLIRKWFKQPSPEDTSPSPTPSPAPEPSPSPAPAPSPTPAPASETAAPPSLTPPPNADKQ